jgi:hypothetical protein
VAVAVVVAVAVAAGDRLTVLVVELIFMLVFVVISYDVIVLV